MTEQEWLACDDPRPLQWFLRGKVSARKVRLLILACCQELWGSWTDKATRVALGAAEQLAERGAARTAKAYVRVPAGQAVLDCGASDPLRRLDVWGPDSSLSEVALATTPQVLLPVIEQLACWQGGSYPWWDWLVHSFGVAGLSAARQAEFFRDVVRGPFRPLFFRAAWRARNEGASVRIAEAIYEARAFDHLPVLADALEDAGCDSDEVLNHLRGSGPHVRGCWALDLLLSKS